MNNNGYEQLIYEGRPRLVYCERCTENDYAVRSCKGSRSCMELMFFLSGAGTVRAAPYSSAPCYDMILLPAYFDRRDQMTLEPGSEILVFGIHFPEMDPPGPIMLQTRDSELYRIVQQAYVESRKKPRNEFILEYMTKLLLTIVTREQLLREEDDALISRLQMYIQNHYGDRLSLEMLAEREHVSVSLITKQFKRCTGMTVIAYINHVRIEEAKRLLITTNQSIAEIAEECGFHSPKYFHRVFRNATGLSVGAFRQMKGASVQRARTDD